MSKTTYEKYADRYPALLEDVEDGAFAAFEAMCCDIDNLHTTIEAQKAEIAELSDKLRFIEGAKQKYKKFCGDEQDRADAAEARVGELEGLLDCEFGG